MPPRKAPTPDTLLRVRELYDAGVPTRDLAGMLSVTESTFWRQRKKWGWPMRHATPSRKAVRDASPDGGSDAVAQADSVSDALIADLLSDPERDVPTARLMRGLRRALEAELIALLASGSRRGTEARARSLASIMRTLALMRGVETPAGMSPSGSSNGDDAAPADAAPADAASIDAASIDLAALRTNLARRLHQLSQERDDP